MLSSITNYLKLFLNWSWLWHKFCTAINFVNCTKFYTKCFYVVINKRLRVNNSRVYPQTRQSIPERMPLLLGNPHRSPREELCLWSERGRIGAGQCSSRLPKRARTNRAAEPHHPKIDARVRIADPLTPSTKKTGKDECRGNWGTRVRRGRTFSSRKWCCFDSCDPCGRTERSSPAALWKF